MLYTAQRCEEYLVDVDNHIDLKCEDVIQFNIFFTIKNLKCLADADSAAEHV